MSPSDPVLVEAEKLAALWGRERVAAILRTLARRALEAHDHELSGEVLLRGRVHRGKLVEVTSSADERVA